MKLKVTSSIVSVDWLNDNRNANNLIVLDATIKKVGSTKDKTKEKLRIPNAIFFDLKNIFLDKNDSFGTINTMQRAKYRFPDSMNTALKLSEMARLPRSLMQLRCLLL
mgnify:CR=1 FL=1